MYMPQNDILFFDFCMMLRASVKPKALCASYTQTDLKKEKLELLTNFIPFLKDITWRI